MQIKNNFIVDRGTLVEYVGNEKDIIIPENVQEIGMYAFKEAKIHTVVIPEGVERIGYRAFSNCTELVKVVLPKSLVRIASSAFEECSSLLNITIPRNITILENGVFYNCKSLRTVKLQDGLIKISSNVFSGCTALKKIYIPKTVEYIGSFALAGCKKLKVVKILGEPYICDMLFYNSPRLEIVTIPTNNEENYSARIGLSTIVRECKVWAVEDKYNHKTIYLLWTR